ncbi:MAG: electron transport complex subunit RsxG [Candidatus Parabeggiatoa sp. nov. 3]|nr:MAG: electron transport complex subunit RsxG [Gammaproteobacteria bacterium]RKZ58109.1 MAG: electron transport complex subunit RsxG [Gammaproteobacteria bacterium]RKZ77071.1 MAG: electron transport complex subunit RsxG [Gammaproteobacteria bacterium]HEW97967.1 electron transport complex subunit RsxG [Beggiatoa sp.]
MLKQILRAASLLTLFAVIGGGLVVFSFEITHEQIKANERAALVRILNTLIPPEHYDNDLLKDSVEMQNEALLGTNEPVTIYRARKEGRPIAAVLTPEAPDGYNGRIRLLVGIDYQGNLMGVRVLSHQETPGLGDKIEVRRSDWIFGFNGRSLSNPKKGGWKVKRDGGIFDQFTGATITPRAVIKALHKTLLFYQQYQNEVFAKK